MTPTDISELLPLDFLPDPQTMRRRADWPVVEGSTNSSAQTKVFTLLSSVRNKLVSDSLWEHIGLLQCMSYFNHLPSTGQAAITNDFISLGHAATVQWINACHALPLPQLHEAATKRFGLGLTRGVLEYVKAHDTACL